jgi:hypothetical protein
MSNVRVLRPKAIEVELGGQPMKVVYDLNAFADLEETYGTVNDAMEALSSGSIKTIRTLLWVGLRSFNPDITEREVGALIGMSGIEAVSEAITLAIEDAMPIEKPLDAVQPGN